VEDTEIDISLAGISFDQSSRRFPQLRKQSIGVGELLLGQGHGGGIILNSRVISMP
jgi:hypothetical protein